MVNRLRKPQQTKGIAINSHILLTESSLYQLTVSTNMFIGKKEVSNVLENKVTFVDGTEKEYTLEQLKYIVTTEEKDDTAMRDLVGLYIADAILEVLKAHDVRK